ncbi:MULTISPECIES: response regulator [unclassified Moraxella]|uniref:response regulator n=1 Tax=unclassified Moraxella TaxID=2685852 RepID=UPI003AF86C9A
MDMNLTNTIDSNSHKPKVAFIDDESRILRTMSLLFRRSHDVFITTDPNEYINFIKTHKVHVAVSDQRMPEREGVDILREVKEVSPDTIRILLTGYADLQAILGSINDGEIYRYLTKPCKSEELLKVIGRATEIALSSQPTTQTPQISTDERTKKLLIIDDNPHVPEKVQACFGNRYEFFYARTLDEAYEYLGSHDIGVCLTDVTVGGENIAPVIYTLKQYAPNLIVLVQTQFQDAHLLIDLINKGQIYRCLPKPIRPNLLQLSLDRGFEQYQKLIDSPTLTQRYEVEVDNSEQTQASISSKIKGFIGRLRLKFG